MNTGKEHISQKTAAAQPIYNITPFTLLDYPDKTACILWFAGCNMRCLYCYNPEIVLGKGKISLDAALKFVYSRKGLLDGVVLSGGECTLHKNINWLVEKIKSAGFLVKIDTNGSNPRALKQLVRDGLVDYVALDYKATSAKFKHITQSKLYKEFDETLNFLTEKKFPFEVRTTVHSNLLSPADLGAMAAKLVECGYRGIYYLQNFVNDTPTLGSPGNSQNCLRDIQEISSELKIVCRN